MWKNETIACPFYQRLVPFLGLLLYLFSAIPSFGACITQTGTVLPSASNVCVNTNLVTLTLSGHAGNVQYWETTTDLTNYQRINSTSTSISISGIGATTYVRANVSSLNCFTANSSLATITSFIVAKVETPLEWQRFVPMKIPETWLSMDLQEVFWDGYILPTISKRIS